MLIGGGTLGIARMPIWAVLVWLNCAVAVGQELCPGSGNLENDSRMPEHVFNTQEATESLLYLRSLAPQIQALVEAGEHGQVAEMQRITRMSPFSLHDSNISYKNNLTQLEGTLLKQALVLAQRDRDIARRSGDRSKKVRAEAAYAKAQADYCAFAVRARYAD